MTLPADMPFGVVTATFDEVLTVSTLDGATEPVVYPGSGYVIFSPNKQYISHDLTDTIYSLPSYEAKLDSTGKIAVMMVSTDGYNFGYTLEFHIDGLVIPSITVEVPANVTTDITELVPAADVSGTLTMRGPRGFSAFLVYNDVTGAYPARESDDPVVFGGPVNPDTLGLMQLDDAWLDTSGTYSAAAATTALDESISGLIPEDSLIAQALDNIYERYGKSFMPETMFGALAWDDFRRPNQSTLHHTYSPSGHYYRGTGADVTKLALVNNSYAPTPDPNVAQILFVDHTKDVTSAACRFRWSVDPGTNPQHNVVLGMCKKYFGTNTFGGSLQAACWNTTMPSTTLEAGGYDWKLFEVGDPVVDPYPTVAFGKFLPWFKFKNDDKTDYVLSIRRTSVNTVAVYLPDGQVVHVTPATHDRAPGTLSAGDPGVDVARAVSRWGRAMGTQLRTVVNGGHARFTGIMSSETPDITAGVSRLPALGAGESLYLPGNDDVTRMESLAPLAAAGDIEVGWAGTLNNWVPAVANTLYSQWTSSKKVWYIQVTSTGRLKFGYSFDGTTALSVSTTSPAPFVAGQRWHVKVTRTSATGSVVFSTSPDGVTWTVLDTQPTTPGDLYQSVEVALQIGQYSSGSPIQGYTRHAWFKSAGTMLSEVDFSKTWNGYDEQGNPWTLYGRDWYWRIDNDHIAPSTAPAIAAPQLDSYIAAGTYTWNKPTGAVRVEVVAISGGSGGGSGRRGAAGTVRAAGAGGAGGLRVIGNYLASDLGATETVTVGAGGAGGAAVTTDSTDGATGTAGGISGFGNTANRWLTAFNGNGGAGGATGAATGGSAGGPGGSTGASSGATGGLGTGAFSATAKGTSLTAGAGASGGGINTSNVDAAGGAGSAPANGSQNAPTGGTASSGIAGANGADAKAGSRLTGGGGAGGGGNSTGAAGAGGNGGFPGGAGGGGGGALNGNNSGKGGNGADGAVYVITYFG